MNVEPIVVAVRFYGTDNDMMSPSQWIVWLVSLAAQETNGPLAIDREVEGSKAHLSYATRKVRTERLCRFRHDHNPLSCLGIVEFHHEGTRDPGDTAFLYINAIEFKRSHWSVTPDVHEDIIQLEGSGDIVQIGRMNDQYGPQWGYEAWQLTLEEGFKADYRISAILEGVRDWLRERQCMSELTFFKNYRVPTSFEF